MFCYLWEFVVRIESFVEFETTYGPQGEWVRLFERDPGYVRTFLLRDRDAPERFVTIDIWSSREAFLAFRERSRSELEALDARCETLTLRESHLGDFEIVRATEDASG